MPTIRDIAESLEIHPSTVSRALNPETRHLVDPARAQSIIAKAQALGYRPNQMAAALRTGQSNTVGVIVSDLQNLLFPPILRGLQDTLALADYFSIEANSDNDMEKEHLALRRLLERQVDGLVIATAHRDDQLIHSYATSKVPIVLVLRAVEGGDVDSVLNDDRAGIQKAMDYLFELGHSRIGCIAGPSHFSTGHIRYTEYVRYLEEHGREVDPDLTVFSGGFTETAGYKATCELFQRTSKVTALIAGNDLLALGAMTYLAEHGIDCPRQVSVIGYGGMPLMDKLQVPLTTIAISTYEMGATAGRFLLEQLKDPMKTRQTRMLTPQLVIRSSTAPAPQLV